MYEEIYIYIYIECDMKVSRKKKKKKKKTQKDESMPCKVTENLIAKIGSF